MPPTPNHRSTMREGVDPMETIASLPLDRSVGPAPNIRGGATKAAAHLEQFLSSRLASYDRDRNDPTIEGTTQLSPYLHFGQISVEEIAARAMSSVESVLWESITIS